MLKITLTKDFPLPRDKLKKWNDTIRIKPKIENKRLMKVPLPPIPLKTLLDKHSFHWTPADVLEVNQIEDKLKKEENRKKEFKADTR